MENLLITPDEAKKFAKAIFVSYHPDNEMWFDIAWEVLEGNELQHKSTSNLRFLPGLAATGEISSEMALMADDFAMFFEAFMTKNPILGVDLAKRIQNIAQRRSSEICNQEKFIQRFSSVLEISDNDKFNSINEMIKEQFGQTNELICEEHNKTRKTVRKPVISSKFNFNCLISMCPTSCEIMINSGFDEITIKLSRVKFDLFKAIAMLNNETKGWAGWEDISRAVPGWSHKGKANKNGNYVRHRIAELRKDLPVNFENLLESRQGHGYRLSTHPDNISIDSA